MALPKAYRLRHRQDFKHVYQSGRRHTSSLLTVRSLFGTFPDNSGRGKKDDAAENLLLMPTRFGISISQKVSKKAVVRNRIKRQLHSGILQLLPRISPGWLIVIGVRSGASDYNYVDFLRELEQLLADAEVLDGHS